jgi:hypothetical protein
MASLNKLYVKTFETIVRQLAQQTDARLRPWVQERSETGSTRNWPRIAKRGTGGALVAKSGRTATPNNDSVWSNRVSVVATYHDADQTEQEDINQVLIDPNSTIAVALAAEARRTVDDVIIAAATGNALDETGASNAFPAAQVFGDYNTEMDFPAITNVAEMFLANDILPDEEKVAIVGPQQARKLLHIAQATNSQYVGQAMALVQNGWVDKWMGFRWILSNRLLKPLPGQVTCLFMTKKALGLQLAKDIWSKVAEDPSQSFAWRIYIAMSMGAVRVEDEHIVAGYFKDTCIVA